VCVGVSVCRCERVYLRECVHLCLSLCVCVCVCVCPISLTQSARGETRITISAYMRPFLRSKRWKNCVCVYICVYMCVYICVCLHVRS